MRRSSPPPSLARARPRLPFSRSPPLTPVVVHSHASSAALTAISNCRDRAALEAGITHLQESVVDSKLEALATAACASEGRAEEDVAVRSSFHFFSFLSSFIIFFCAHLFLVCSSISLFLQEDVAVRRVFRSVNHMVNAAHGAACLAQQREIAHRVIVTVVQRRGCAVAAADIVAAFASEDLQDALVARRTNDMLEMVRENVGEAFTYTPLAVVEPAAAEEGAATAATAATAAATTAAVEGALSSAAVEELSSIFDEIASVSPVECSGGDDARIARLHAFLETHNKRLDELHAVHEMSPAFRGWLSSQLAQILPSATARPIASPAAEKTRCITRELDSTFADVEVRSVVLLNLARKSRPSISHTLLLSPLPLLPLLRYNDIISARWRTPTRRTASRRRRRAAIKKRTRPPPTARHSTAFRTR